MIRKSPAIFFFGMFLFAWNVYPTARADERPAIASNTRAYALGHHPHLFLDDHLIVRRQNVRKKLQRPVPHPENPVIRREHPWESLRAHAYGNAMYDPSRKRFRLWYLAYGPKWKPSKLAYAESLDGVHWKKPLLKQHALKGHTASNIVLAPPGGTNGARVFLDSHETNSARRYKVFFDTYTSKGRVQKVAFSADGIHWQPPEGILVLTGKKDSGTSAFWSEKLGKYMAYVRGYDPPPKPKPGALPVRRARVVDYIESTDFLHWSKPITVVRTDARDGDASVQTYGMAVTPYGDQFIGMLWILHIHEMQENHEFGIIDVQLTVSRDGKNWQRAGNRETFLPVGRPGSWDDEERRTIQTFFVHDDRIYIYYTGCPQPHAAGSPGAIGLATLPADRFVSVERVFTNQPALIETRLLTAPAGELLVNADLPANGSLSVEALDANGKTLEGFEVHACQLTRHDALRYRVRWKDKRSLPQLRTVSPNFRLRFQINGTARLFAFQIVDGSES